MGNIFHIHLTKIYQLFIFSLICFLCLVKQNCEQQKLLPEPPISLPLAELTSSGSFSSRLPALYLDCYSSITAPFTWLTPVSSGLNLKVISSRRHFLTPKLENLGDPSPFPSLHSSHLVVHYPHTTYSLPCAPRKQRLQFSWSSLYS